MKKSLNSKAFFAFCVLTNQNGDVIIYTIILKNEMKGDKNDRFFLKNT